MPMSTLRCSVLRIRLQVVRRLFQSTDSALALDTTPRSTGICLATPGDASTAYVPTIVVVEIWSRSGACWTAASLR